MSNILKQFHTFSSADLQTSPRLTRNMQLIMTSDDLQCYVKVLGHLSFLYILLSLIFLSGCEN